MDLKGACEWLGDNVTVCTHQIGRRHCRPVSISLPADGRSWLSRGKSGTVEEKTISRVKVYDEQTYALVLLS
jgi:hypothetical protein